MNLVVLLSIPGVLAFLAAMSLFLRRGHRRTRSLLAFTLLVFSVAQCSYAQYYNPAFVDNALFDPLYTVAMCLVPPFYCLFIASMTYPKMKRAGGLLFFSLSAVYIVMYLASLATLSPEDYHVYSYNVLLGNPYNGTLDASVKWMKFIGYGVFRIMMPALMLMTTYASIVRISKYYKLLQNYDSRVAEMIKIPRAIVLHFSCGFAPLWIIMTMFPLFRINIPLTIVVVILMSIMFVFIGFYGHMISFTSEDLKDIYKGYTSPETQTVITTPAASVTDGADGLCTPEIARFDKVSRALVKAMEVDRIFLDPNLTIIALSDRVGANFNYVSKVISLLYEKTFSDYVAMYRVAYAKQLLLASGGKDLDMDYLARECGYSFYSMFLKDFQSQTGVTPAKWIESRENS